MHPCIWRRPGSRCVCHMGPRRPWPLFLLPRGLLQGKGASLPHFPSPLPPPARGGQEDFKAWSAQGSLGWWLPRLIFPGGWGRGGRRGVPLSGVAAGAGGEATGAEGGGSLRGQACQPLFPVPGCYDDKTWPCVGSAASQGTAPAQTPLISVAPRAWPGGIIIRFYRRGN